MPADTFETLILPNPPTEREILTVEDAARSLKEQVQWNKALATYSNDLYNVLHDGYLVRTWRIEELTADLITAGTITTEELYIYDSHFQIDGANGQIVITDENDTTRLVIGKFGSGTAYGIKGYKSDGTLMFNISDTVSLNGALITNGTLSGNTLITGTVNGTSLANLTIPAGKYGTGSIVNQDIGNLSASKITVSGTLTCTSSTTAINVTSAGVVIFSGGGDIIMKATASDSNFISFRNASNSERGLISYSPTSNIFYINNGNGSNLYIDATYGSGSPQALIRATGDATLRSTSGSAFVEKTGGASIQVSTNITLTPSTVTVSAGNLRADTDSSRDCGTSGIRWANGWFDLVNGADYCMDNGYRITEADKVYEGADPKSAILFMNDRWEPIMALDRTGNLWVKGYIAGLHQFLPPSVARRDNNTDAEERCLN